MYHIIFYDIYTIIIWFYYLLILFINYLQCDKLRDLVGKMRGTLAKKDDTEPEEIKRQTNELQQASLKLFEMAYKKVCNLLKFIWNFNNIII